MATLIEALKSIEPYITSGAAITTLLAAWKVARQSKRWTDALDTVERIEKLVEGDKTAHHEPKIRDGLLRRLEIIEELAGKSTLTSKLFRAFLRAVGIPSDYEDEEKLERVARDRFSSELPTQRNILTEADRDRLGRLDRERIERERLAREEVEQRDRADRISADRVSRERERTHRDHEREREREEDEREDSRYGYISHHTDVVDPPTPQPRKRIDRGGTK